MKQFLITVAGVLTGLVLFIVHWAVPADRHDRRLVQAAARRSPRTWSWRSISASRMTDQRPQQPVRRLRRAATRCWTCSAGSTRRAPTTRSRASTSAPTRGGLPAAQAEELRAALARLPRVRQVRRRAPPERRRAHGHAGLHGRRRLRRSVAAGTRANSCRWACRPKSRSSAGTLQRYHMQAQFETREDYKTAAPTRSRSAASRRRTVSRSLTLMNGTLRQHAGQHRRRPRASPPQATRAAVEVDAVHRAARA